MSKTETPELVEIVTAFVDELKRFEYLVGEAERPNLSTDKGVRRAAKAAAEAADSEAVIAKLMGRFAAALNEARTRNEAAQQRLRNREQEIVNHDLAHKGLVERFAGLGEAAKQVSVAIQLVAGDGVAKPDSLAKIDQLIAAFLDEAKKLVDDARAAEMNDFAHEVEALRKTIHAAREKLGILAPIQ